MGQGPEISELQQRVEAVGVRFGEVAEDSRQRGERLASLLGQVEKGVVRGRHEIDWLTQTLEAATDREYAASRPAGDSSHHGRKDRWTGR